MKILLFISLLLLTPQGYNTHQMPPIVICAGVTTYVDSGNTSIWVSNNTNVVIAGTIAGYAYVQGVSEGGATVTHYLGDSANIYSITVTNCEK